MDDQLKKIIEDEAEKHAYDQEKPLSTWERIFSYQAFIAGAEFIVKKSSFEKPVKKKVQDV